MALARSARLLLTTPSKSLSRASRCKELNCENVLRFAVIGRTTLVAAVEATAHEHTRQVRVNNRQFNISNTLLRQLKMSNVE